MRLRAKWTAMLLGLMAPGLLLMQACSPGAENRGGEAVDAETLTAGGGEDFPFDESILEQLPPYAEIAREAKIGQKGGQIVLPIVGDPKTFNEPISTDATSGEVMAFLTGGLTGYDRIKQTDMPGLARSWEYDEAAQTWTFHIRPELKWSDGAPLTSDDFLFFTEVVMHPDVPSPIRDFFRTENGEDFAFSAPDPLTFVATIPEVDSFAFLNLGLIRAWPRHAYGKYLEDGTYTEKLGVDTPPSELLSAGPFIMTGYRSGQQLTFAPNPHYYQFDREGTRLPYVNEMIMVSVPDASAQTLRFQAGDIDYLESIQPQDLVSVQDEAEERGYEVFFTGLSLANNHYWFNLKQGGTYTGPDGRQRTWMPGTPGEELPANVRNSNYRPFIPAYKQAWFANETFRKACSMATNREAIVRTILFGEGEPLYGPVSPTNKQWYNPDIPKFPYDLEKAAELLDSIGFTDRDGDGIREDPDGNPIRFTLITNKENGVREKVGVLIKEDMTRLGFDVTLQLLDFNNILTKINDSFDYDACLMGLTSGVPPHPAMSANTWLSSGAMHQWNPNQETPATEWEAELDRLYNSMKKEFDVENQAEIFKRMQVIWAEHQPMIHLFTSNHYAAVYDNIGNIKPTPLRPQLTHNIEQHYVK